jgi:hypothetical protein
MRLRQGGVGLGGRLGAIAIVAAMMVTGCGPSAADRATIHRWLLCEECLAGELDSVVALGGGAVGELTEALSGPGPNRIANVRQQFVQSYRRAASYAAQHNDTLSVTEAQYVTHFLDNYVALYQSRAAVALGRIATGPAKAALLEALRRDSLYRPDVQRTLGSVLDVSLVVVAGDGQTTPPDSTVAILPTVAVRDSAGDPIQAVRVVFTVDSGGGHVTDSVARTDTAGRASPGSWRMGPGPGRNSLRAMAAGRVVRIGATAVP